MASTPYSLSVTDGTELQLSLTGPQGPAGPTGAAGPNTVTTATTTTITGLLKGNGSTVLAATAGTDYAAAIHTHVTADITDATSDGQTNPGKLLKTDANGALQINTLSLGSSDIDATDPGELIIYNATDVESVYGSIKSSNLTTARDFELPNTSGTIMVGANNLSEISSASTARTNLGLGTGNSPEFAGLIIAGLAQQNVATSANPSFARVRTSVNFSMLSRWQIDSSVNGTMRYLDWNNTTGYIVDFTTDGVVKFRSRDNTTDAEVTVSNLTASGTVSAANGVFTTGANIGAATGTSFTVAANVGVISAGDSIVQFNAGPGGTSTRNILTGPRTALAGLSGGGLLVKNQSGVTAPIECSNLTASGTVSAANLSLTNPLSLANGGTGGTDASTARTNLGLGTGDSVTFASVSATSAGGTNTLAGVTVISTSGRIEPSSDGARSVGTASKRFLDANIITVNCTNLTASGTVTATNGTYSSVQGWNGAVGGYFQFGSGATLLGLCSPNNDNLSPVINGTLSNGGVDLGKPTFRFRTAYVNNVAASGTVTAADLALTEKSADPADPAEGKSVIWQSDGTGAGDDGDIMIKITAGGVTKTGTIIDFSTL